MAWRTTCVKEERIKMISSYLEGEETISELAAQYGISRKTVYKWIERFEAKGPGALEDRSRAPLHHPNAVSEAVEQAVLELKGERPLWGAPKLRRKLQMGLKGEECPAESTISEILRRHGLSRRMRRRWRAVPSTQPFAAHQAANAVWCADFKGWFYTGDGARCTPLTISDGHSRYLLCCQGLGGTTGFATVRPLFEATFREYGLPRAIRTDNGPPFATRGLGGLSQLAVWWMRLGIDLERIEPGQPQQNGRHERMHRTLKDATARPPRANLRRQQEAFDTFRLEYNQERPHEALGQRPPAQVYQPSLRDYPQRLPQLRGYPDEWQKRKVRPSGQIKWKGLEPYISEALVGLEVGLEPIGDGLWAIHFEGLKLGTYDERRQQIRPIRRLQPNHKTNHQQLP
jgi:transposase InsO family protein